MMQRRNYELIAKVLRAAKPSETNPETSWEELVEAFAYALKEDNVQFRYARFFDACGMEEEDE